MLPVIAHILNLRMATRQVKAIGLNALAGLNAPGQTDYRRDARTGGLAWRWIRDRGFFPKMTDMSESSPATFPVTTALGLEGMTVERDLGLTFGLVVRSMGFAKSFGAGLTALRQGEVP